MKLIFGGVLMFLWSYIFKSLLHLKYHRELFFIVLDSKKLNQKTLWIGFILFFFASGCFRIGPSSVPIDRTRYNFSIQESNDQQLLLNLIRLKYRNTPYFLEVSNITSHFRLFAGGNASAALSMQTTNIFGFGGSLQVEESPTITYTPLQGEQFTQRILAKIQIETIHLLLKSGWSIDRVLRICLEQLGGLINAPTASGPTPTWAPVFQDFSRATHLLRELQLRGVLSIDLGSYESATQLIFQVNTIMGELPELAELNSLLGLPPHNKEFILTLVHDEKENNLTIQTRSLLGMMYYLSHAIEVPQMDLNAGYTTLTKTADGKLFDWIILSGDLLSIKTHTSLPQGASTAVYYKSNWYYIDNADLDSKSTFSLLGQIFYLQAGTPRGTAPLLTIPVGG